MTAILSACERYRYRLERPAKDDGYGAVAFVMLNPSTADATRDDPTIRRCVAYARAWGYERLIVGNAYAWRATDPKELLTVDDPVGPDNDRHLSQILADARLVVCAWGTKIKPDRQAAVLQLLHDYNCHARALKVTKDGFPSHPLYLSAALVPTRWTPT